MTTSPKVKQDNAKKRVLNNTAKKLKQKLEQQRTANKKRATINARNKASKEAAAARNLQHAERRKMNIAEHKRTINKKMKNRLNKFKQMSPVSTLSAKNMIPSGKKGYVQQQKELINSKVAKQTPGFKKGGKRTTHKKPRK